MALFARESASNFIKYENYVHHMMKNISDT